MKKEKEPTAPKKKGPPSKYETHVLPKINVIKGWAQAGLIDKQIAANLNVSGAAFSDYKQKYPELAEALRISKEEADYEIVNALYKTAFGFTGPDGKYYPPNSTAQIFWLKNRDQRNWRDRQHINHGGGIVSKVVDYSHLSDEELEKEMSGYNDND